MSYRKLRAGDPESFFASLFRRIPRHILITFISAFVLGFLIHGFVFSNKFLNHDDIGHLFGSDYGVASGRWLLPFALGLDGQVSVPWFIGVLSLLCLSVSASLTVAVLRIKSAFACVITAAVMVAFPTVGATFTYMFSADAYFPFFANRDYLYLAGVNFEGLALLLHKTPDGITETLYILPKDVLKERWTGRRYSAEEARAISGIEDIRTVEQLENDVFEAFRFGRATTLWLDLFKRKPGLPDPCWRSPSASCAGDFRCAPSEKR